jgi:hypothetical protein
VEADRQILEHLEPYLRETEPDGAAAMLALVARDRVPLDGDEVSAAVRRALLVLLADEDRAWRALAAAILADELTDDAD